MRPTIAFALALMAVSGTLSAQDVTVRTLLSKDIDGVPGKELTTIVVEYPPGGGDPIHTHSAHAVVFVLEGSVVMQVKGGKPTTVMPGQTFYEGPDDVHIVGRNTSDSAPARFVVFLVKDKGAPLFSPAQ